MRYFIEMDHIIIEKKTISFIKTNFIHLYFKNIIYSDFD